MICNCVLAGTAACKTCRNNPDSMGQSYNFVTGTTTVAYTPQITYVPERTCHWEYPQGVNGWLGFAVCSSCGEKYDECVTDTAHYCPNCGAKVVDE